MHQDIAECAPSKAPPPSLSAPLVSDGEGHKEGVEEGRTHTSFYFSSVSCLFVFSSSYFFLCLSDTHLVLFFFCFFGFLFLFLIFSPVCQTHTSFYFSSVFCLFFCFLFFTLFVRHTPRFILSSVFFKCQTQISYVWKRFLFPLIFFFLGNS